MLLFTLIACPKPVDIEGPPVPVGLPVVPAPVAPVYTRAPGIPSDELVRWAVGDYDETLAGAAAALAFIHDEHDAIDEAAIRWALFRAGWPYGFQKVDLVTVPADTTPDGLVTTARALPEGTPVGLARVRDDDGDTWVLIVGDVAADLPPFDREAEVGEALDLGVTQRALAPGGELVEGAFVYGEPGEWVVEASGDDWLVSVPVYVGEITPEDGPFIAVDTLRPSVEQAEVGAEGKVNVLRDLLGADDLDVDPVLSSLARTAADADAFEPSTVYGGSAVAISCTGQTVQGCLDRTFWSIDSRALLANPEHTHMGIAARWTTDGLRLWVILAG